MGLDEHLEELISAEGELAKPRLHSDRQAMEADTSLDALLDSFIDEELGDEALADAAAYGVGEHFDRPTPLREADAESAAMPMLPASAEPPPETAPQEPMAPRQTQAPYTPLPNDAAPRRAGRFWRGLGLVLLGGLLGATLTLLALLYRSGTLDYAARSQFEALSRNMDTMQANQELTWQRLNALDPQFAAQEAAIAGMAQELAQTQQEAAAAQAEVTALTQEVTALREQLAVNLDQTQTRMDSIEGQAATLDATVTTLESAVSPLQSSMERLDEFFTQMRDLLIELQGAP